MRCADDARHLRIARLRPCPPTVHVPLPLSIGDRDMGHDDAVGTSNRERRAAKQRRRDQKRGRDVGARPSADRGLSADALRQVLRSTADDLAASSAGSGGDAADGDGPHRVLTELRHVLAEHLARRRDEVLTACDEVLADFDVSATEGAAVRDVSATGGTAVGGPAADTSARGGARAVGAGPVDAELVDALVDAVRSGATVGSWARDLGLRTEDAAVATVWLLARTRSADDDPSPAHP